MLNPPPILRVAGPLLPQLTKATLSACFTDDYAHPTLLSSQTHHIPLTYQPPEPTSLPPGLRPKRLEKETQKMRLREQASRYGFGQTLPFERQKRAEKEREALSDGLAFPGLWVDEAIVRHKEFRLELHLGHPNDESVEPVGPTDRSGSTSAVGARSGQPVALGNADPVLENEAMPASAPSTDLPSAGQEESRNMASELFPDHQTLEEASHDIKQYLVDDHGRDPNPTDTQHDSTLLQNQKISGPSTMQSNPNYVRPWATFISSPLAVVSKPSQKTSKARSMTSCLTTSDSFSLWVRINGQTVRTKYMKLDVGTGDDAESSLTTRTGQWTPFKFEIVDRARPFDDAGTSMSSDRPSSSRRRAPVLTENILTYGSIGRLVDLQSGIRTETMRLVKIDKNENVVGTDHGHPVSDLQRVGFVRLLIGADDYTGGGRWYLSAPGARLGGAEVFAPAAQPQAFTTPEPGSTNQDAETLDSAANLVAHDPANAPAPPTRTAVKTKKKKTRRFALAEAVVAEDAGGVEFALSWTKASRFEAERARGFGKDSVKKLEVCEKVEDWMFWTLGGVGEWLSSHVPSLRSFRRRLISVKPAFRIASLTGLKDPKSYLNHLSTLSPDLFVRRYFNRRPTLLNSLYPTSSRLTLSVDRNHIKSTLVLSAPYRYRYTAPSPLRNPEPMMA